VDSETKNRLTALKEQEAWFKDEIAAVEARMERKTREERTLLTELRDGYMRVLRQRGRVIGGD
jgi:hypothetical protein